jgi:uncharacterized OsmC-like protein
MTHTSVVVHETGPGRLAETITVRAHTLHADEPIEQGGTDTGPNPYDLLCAALGACTTMTLRLYADQKKWPLQRVSVQVSHAKIHAADCADCETRVQTHKIHHTRAATRQTDARKFLANLS